MKTQLRHWTIAAAALVLAVGAAAQTTDSGKLKLIPNSQKYRVSGAQPATGRSGSAVLRARALMNKDNSADIEVTTGKLDSAATPPGNIAKIQYKPLDKNGKPIFVTNWNGLNSGGYFHQNVNGLAHKQQMQIQASATGIDPNRTDVVTLSGAAVLRPDLMVSGIQPSSGHVNVPLNISAAVQEMNQDTGASANCVLYINGVQADHATNIWVDHGGTVSCMFTHQFTSAGSYDLKVAVENVAPADYDTTNNSATATIKIASPDSLNFSADASDLQVNMFSQQDVTDFFGAQIVDFESDQVTSTGWMQASTLNFSQNASFNFPFSALVTESSDASSTSLSGNFPLVSADTSTTCQFGPANCTETRASRSDGGFLLSVSSKVTVDSIAGNSASFSGQVLRNAGDVTFISTQAICDWSDPSCPGDAQYYVVNNFATGPGPGGNPAGTRLAFGTRDILQFSITDAGGNHYSVNAVIPLTATTNVSQQPNSCMDFPGFDPSFHTSSCSQSSNQTTIKQGSIKSPQQ